MHIVFIPLHNSEADGGNFSFKKGLQNEHEALRKRTNKSHCKLNDFKYTDLM